MKNNGANAEEKTLETWWQDRSKLEKRLIVASAISVAVLMIILFVYALISNEPEVCTSSTCVRTSMELLNYVDLHQDPCRDFYRFACGKFQQTPSYSSLEHSRDTWTALNVAEEEIQSHVRNLLEEPLSSDVETMLNSAKRFYRACINETAIESDRFVGVMRIFEQFGGWPTLKGHNWRESAFNWTETVYKLRKIGINPEFFVVLALQRDKADPNKYILNLKDPGYSPSHISDPVKNLYLDYMVDVAVILGADKERAKRDQANVLEFILKLGQISEEAKAANGTKDYNPLSLSELQYAFHDFPWPEYINNILKPAAQITHDDIVTVSDPLYLEKVLDIIRVTNKRVLANFMSWQIVQHLINYLSPRILDRAYEYLTKVNGKVTRENRSSMCTKSVIEKMSPIVAAGYMETHLEDASRSRVIALIRNIKYRFKEDLMQLDWLDWKAKEMAAGKLVASVEDIASWNTLQESIQLYEQVDISETELLTSVLNLDYLNANIQYAKLSQYPAFDDDSSPGSVMGLNVVYSKRENVLRIPLGLFQSIFYQKDRPEYMNYGALGAVIAREIYHVITQAKYGDFQGELRSSWSSYSLLNYEERKQCLQNSTLQNNANNNNNESRDDNMAELFGIKVAYDTYVEWSRENLFEARLPGLNYSPNQLFWISSTVRHCARYSGHNSQRQANRINGILKNFHEFAIDFGCTNDAEMNPTQKCHVL